MARFSTIYVDFDGVLSDFHTAACVAHGLPYSRFNWPVGVKSFDDIPPLNASKGERFWRPILDTPDFWLEMEVFRWAKELLDRLEQYTGPRGVVILTSPATLENGRDEKQKMRWLGQRGFNYEVIFEGNKWKYSNPGALLIDDWEKQVCRFNRYHGDAILFPQPWNTHAPYWLDPLTYVFAEIELLLSHQD